MASSELPNCQCPLCQGGADHPERERLRQLLLVFNRLDERVRQELDAAGQAAQRLLVLADGADDTVGLWLGLPARTILVVRTAKNRRLRELPVAHREMKSGLSVGQKQCWNRRSAVVSV